MIPEFQQHERAAELTTALGENKLVLVEFTTTEAISEPFEFDIVALSNQEESEQHEFDKVLGTTCTLRVSTPTHGVRFLAGSLVQAQRIGWESGVGAYYALKLRPWFWLLNHRVNSRIFNEMAIKDIISNVFADYADIADADYYALPDYQLEYCVQHQESDFAFLSRLMERYGISYHFRFGDNKQTMVIAGDNSAFTPVAGASRRFEAAAKHPAVQEEVLWGWVSQRRFSTGQVKLNEYNFKKSDANLVQQRKAGSRYAKGDLQVYRYPGGYPEGVGQNDIANAALNALQIFDTQYLAEGSCLSFSAGQIMQLEGHPDAGEHLILRCRHHFSAQNYASGGSGGEEYVGNYTLMQAQRTFAPPQVTPRPFIPGPQTGVVTHDRNSDPEGYGRLRVRFHWNPDEETTMWCRVAETWAGSEWGNQFHPRVDMEVLVHFIDGDPDYPVIIGSLYNEKHPAPFEFDHTSGIRTESMNELSFSDKQGSELIKILGTKDLTAQVQNDVLIEAQNTITITVGSSKIVMDKTSIKLEAMNIQVNAKMDLKTTSSATASHEAGAVMTIKAPLVKIN